MKKTRASGRGVALTNGCFDLVHAGHIACLRHVREIAVKHSCELLVAVNVDDSVRRIKGKHRPYVSLSDRVAVLRELRCVDAVTIFYQDTPKHLIELVKPEILAKSEQYLYDEVVGAEFVESYGGRVILTPHLPGLSTTEIVSKIKLELGGK